MDQQGASGEGRLSGTPVPGSLEAPVAPPSVAPLPAPRLPQRPLVDPTAPVSGGRLSCATSGSQPGPLFFTLAENTYPLIQVRPQLGASRTRGRRTRLPRHEGNKGSPGHEGSAEPKAKCNLAHGVPPVGDVPVQGVGIVLPRGEKRARLAAHTSKGTYRCFFPDLTGLVLRRHTGPGPPCVAGFRRRGTPQEVVEMSGIEPLTSSLRTKRSPN